MSIATPQAPCPKLPDPSIVRGGNAPRGNCRSHRAIWLLSFGLIVVAALWGKEYRARVKQVERFEQAQEEMYIDRGLASLRIPYEAIIWNTKDIRAISEILANRCKETGLTSISPYSAVIQDQKNDWKIDTPALADTIHTIFSNASIDRHFWEEYIQGCYRVRHEIGRSDTPLGRAFARKDEQVLRVVRLHVARALKSKEPHMVLASCKLWLALFEPNEDVLARLSELAAKKDRGRYTTITNETYDDYSGETITAVRIIDQYSLPIPYPQDVKTGRAYAEHKELFGD